MKTAENLAQRIYGDLLALRKEPNRGNVSRWLCWCYCGNITIADAYKLKTGHTKSCGCYRNKFRSTHGEASKNRTPEYGVWAAMVKRCRNETDPAYEDYGGRGIAVCQEWEHHYENFIRDMGRRPSDKHSIDRIDNDNNYSCGHCEDCMNKGWTFNCRWATPLVQHRNKRRNRWLEYNGFRMVLTDWAIKLDVTSGTILRHLKGGEKFEDIVEYFQTDKFKNMASRGKNKNRKKL